MVMMTGTFSLHTQLTVNQQALNFVYEYFHFKREVAVVAAVVGKKGICCQIFDKLQKFPTVMIEVACV